MTESIVYLDKLVRKRPLLSRDEEEKLANRMINGDISAKNMMIESNIRLVIYNAKLFKKRHKRASMCDLISEGVLGLMRACETYDPARAKFSTFASWWIRNKMHELMGSDYLIKVPRYVYSLEDHDPKKKAMNSVRQLISITEIEVPNRENDDARINEQLVQKYLVKIAEIIPSQHLYILKRRHGLIIGKKNTLRQIGKEVGLTRERIRQILVITHKKIKTLLGEESCESSNI